MPNKINNKDEKRCWKLVYTKFQPAKESLRETLCVLGNGYFATRGALNECSASRSHYPGTYIAGVYDKLKTHIAGKNIENEDLVNCPNWLLLTFKVNDGEWICPSEESILSYYQELDFKKGILYRKMRVEDNQGRITTIESSRIVHRVYPHRAAIKYVLIPENYDGTIVVRSGLDGTVENTGVARYQDLKTKHFSQVSMGAFQNNSIYLSVKTMKSKVEIVLASKLRVFINDGELLPRKKTVVKKKKCIFQDFEFAVSKKKRYQIEKIVSLYTSRDKEVKDAKESAIYSVNKSDCFDTLLKSHVHAWSALWKKYEIDIQGDNFALKVLRLHSFHLLQTGSIHNTIIDAGFPARGLHGEAYRGHIFWDGIFVMPFFILHVPDIAKAFLLYRFWRLPKAREYAKENGYKGAMFPWQSGSTGEEETQVLHLNPLSGKWGPDLSRIQRHVSFAIGYNTWEYWSITHDIQFLQKYGAEMILSIAQFGASLTFYDSKDGHYHTSGVMGPDEFHEHLPWSDQPGFKNNAYTNVMIVWILMKARKCLSLISSSHKDYLLKKLNISKDDIVHWKDISKKMKIVMNEHGVIGQFEGYFDLKDVDLREYKEKYKHIGRMDRILKAEGKSPNDYKIIKQADVLMMFYLFPLSEVKKIFNNLGYYYDSHLLSKNFEYYLKRTSHGSTLSKIVHSYIAHLLDRPTESWKLYTDVLKSDIYDIQGGTTPEGVHTGVMGGSMDFVVRAAAGIVITEDKIFINPKLPQNWERVKFNFCCRGSWFSIDLTKHKMNLLIFGQKNKQFSMPVEIFGQTRYLSFGKKYNISTVRKETKILQGKGPAKMYQGRVLVVDGDIMHSQLLHTRLQAMQYLVDTVHTAKNALNILKTKWVDIIVLDIVLLGDMHGIDLLKKIRANKKYDDIPIVVQSNKHTLKNTILSLGADTFFEKTYSMDIFLHDITHLFELRTMKIEKKRSKENRV